MSDIKEMTFEKAFLACNYLVSKSPDYLVGGRLGRVLEVIVLTFHVEDPTTYEFSNDIINRISKEYAETFWDFMISGKANIDGEFSRWPGVERFFRKKEGSMLPDNFNSLYGPRIANQIGVIIQELSDNPDTRRAVLHILGHEDHVLLAAEEMIEYPCTVCVTYFIRDGKLNAHCLMRSQNVATVLQLDMYLQGRLLCHLAEELGLPTGSYYSTMTSAHIHERDLSYVETFFPQEQS